MQRDEHIPRGNTFYRWLVGQAARRPSAPAVASAERAFDYASLRLQVDRLAGELQAVGLSAGDRIAVIAVGSPTGVVALLAVAAIGGVIVPLHPDTPPGRVTVVARDCDARALLSSSDLAHAATRGATRFEVVAEIDGVEIAMPTNGAAESAADSSPGVILYTSGTTGESKGAAFAESALAWTTEKVAATLSSAAEDLVVSALPLAFTYGFSQLLISLYVGSCLMFSPSRTLDSQLALVRREQATVFPIVPSMLASMMKYRRDWYSFPSVRYITSAGALLTPTLLDHARRVFPKAEIFVMYGTTECGRVAMLTPEDSGRRPRSVGQPLDGLQTRIVDEEGRTLAPGGIGELLVRGPGIMQGYVSGAGNGGTLGIDPAGWVHTGDLFRADGGGYLEFVARHSTMIKSGGFRVSPREVEEVLTAHPDVVEAAVIGTPDDVLGEAITAYVVLRDGGEDSGQVRKHCALFRKHCAHRLESFKVPHGVIAVPALPRNMNGKVDIEALKLWRRS